MNTEELLGQLRHELSMVHTVLVRIDDDEKVSVFDAIALARYLRNANAMSQQIEVLALKHVPKLKDEL